MGYAPSSKYGHKLKTDEPDEEKLSSSDDHAFELRTVRSELEESRSEIRRLSDELRRLRQSEQNLESEKLILQGKLLHVDPLGKTEAPPKYSPSIPKLSAPSPSSHQL